MLDKDAGFIDPRDRIRAMMGQQKITLKELSFGTQIPVSTLSDLIGKKTKKIDLEKINKICGVLNYPLNKI